MHPPSVVEGYPVDAAHRAPLATAYRRYIKASKGKAFAIDPAKIEADARFDGLFILRTNAKISALQVVLRYRNLLAVEDTTRLPGDSTCQTSRYDPRILWCLKLYPQANRLIEGNYFLGTAEVGARAATEVFANAADFTESGMTSEGRPG